MHIVCDSEIQNGSVCKFKLNILAFGYLAILGIQSINKLRFVPCISATKKNKKNIWCNVNLESFCSLLFTLTLNCIEKKTQIQHFTITYVITEPFRMKSYILKSIFYHRNIMDQTAGFLITIKKSSSKWHGQIQRDKISRDIVNSLYRKKISTLFV